jgi:hypothetical protein
MRTHELKLRIQRADYVVDPAIVAMAILRHAVSYRRCWNPVAAFSIPAASRTTPGRPAAFDEDPATDPIHVTGAAASAAARSSEPVQKHSS